MRVIYLVEEPSRRGFAYAPCPGIRCVVSRSSDQTDDGSVWMTIRSFSRPSSKRWWLVYPALRIAQAVAVRRYLRALSVPID